MATVGKKSYWNETRTKDLLRNSDRAVEAALLVLYDNQTSDEQIEATVSADNGIGFSSTEGEFGTSLAKQVLARRTSWDQGYTALSSKQLTFARKIALHHWRQFALALNGERKAKGLPMEPPVAVPTPAQGSRFTWAPGDVHTERASGERYEHGYAEELFDEADELFEGGC